MADFGKHVEPLIAKEGGYLLHEVKGDRGGKTYAGIAINYNRDWPGWKLIRERGYRVGDTITDPDIVELVHELYRRKYWAPLRLDEIESEEIAEILLSSSVLSGPRTCSKLSQLVVGVTVDGKVGPVTVGKINEEDPEKFTALFTIARIARFCDIVMRNRKQSKFLLGWTMRCLRELGIRK